MSRINTGIFSNATPLSAPEADQVQLACIENKEIVAYVDENGNVCFAGPTSYDVPYIEQIKDLAWSEAYEVHKLHDIGTGNSNPDYYYDLKRAYKKLGKNDYKLTGLFAHIWDDPGDGGDGKRQWMKWPDFLFRGMDVNPIESLPALITDNGRIPAQCTIKRQRVGSDPLVFNAGEQMPVLQQGDLVYADLRDNSADHMPVSGSGLYLVMQEGFSTLTEARHAFYNQIRWVLVLSGEADENFLAASDPEVLSMFVSVDSPISDEEALFSELEVGLGITGLTTTSFKASLDQHLFISLIGSGMDDLTPATFFSEVFGLTTKMIGMDFMYPVSSWSDTTNGMSHLLYLPTCVERIGSSAFRECGSITAFSAATNIPLTIGADAFNAASSFTLLVPFGSLIVKSNSFSNCDVSTAVISGKAIGENAFSNNSGLTDVTIIDGVTSIGNSAFAYCTSLPSITIPNSVTNIGDYAFQDCTSLTSITIPDSVTSLGDSAFTGCTGLTNATIGNGLNSIGLRTFHGCSNLTSVSLPNSLEFINDRAFINCISLASINIPDSVMYISDKAFYNCTSLSSITYSGTVSKWNSYIEKGADWAKGVPCEAVQCIDGLVPIQQQ